MAVCVFKCASLIWSYWIYLYINAISFISFFQSKIFHAFFADTSGVVLRTYTHSFSYELSSCGCLLNMWLPRWQVAFDDTSASAKWLEVNRLWCGQMCSISNGFYKEFLFFVFKISYCGKLRAKIFGAKTKNIRKRQFEEARKKVNFGSTDCCCYPHKYKSFYTRIWFWSVIFYGTYLYMP